MKKMSEEKIVIRRFSKRDQKEAKVFLDFDNSLAEEDLMLIRNKKKTLAEESKQLEKRLKGISKKEEALLFVVQDGQIVGTVSVKLHGDTKSHVAEVIGLKIRKEYRRRGLGKHLVKEAIVVVKKELKHKPKMLRLSVFANNEGAVKLYKKMGFKVVARIPKQLRYKRKLVDEVVMVKNIW